MVKYKDYYVVFEEIPDEITLAINITNCPHKCKGCHSPELRGNIGEILSFDEIDKIIDENKGITCVCFMGDGNDFDGLVKLSKHVKGKYLLNTAIYSGYEYLDIDFCKNFDYVKTGPYIEKDGPLNVSTTNQRMFKREGNDFINITEKFWKRQ